tara:strand:+ start:940 stop:1413 length:474 start_codon:yes stop_codon:yes gene_type:complete
MKKINKDYLFFFILFFFLNFFVSKSLSSEDINFLSLKNNEANLRLGPSFEYPVKLTYNKKHLPIIILDKSDAWRKIKDFENNSGWIHISQLSKRRTAINYKNNSILFKKPTIYSKPIARLESGRLVLIDKCNLKWCKINSGSFKGWIEKNSLWGNIK